MQRYVSDYHLAERYGVSRSTIWRWVAKKYLPQPYRLSDNCTRWDLAEVEERELARKGAANG
jgi:prophage regulatory protein